MCVSVCKDERDVWRVQDVVGGRIDPEHPDNAVILSEKINKSTNVVLKNITLLDLRAFFYFETCHNIIENSFIGHSCRI